MTYRIIPNSEERACFSDGTPIDDSNSVYFTFTLPNPDKLAKERAAKLAAEHPECEVVFQPSQSGLCAVVAINKRS